MTLFFLSMIPGLWENLLQRRPMLVYAATWLSLITAAVAAASLAPEAAFLWALSPSSPFARACRGAVRLPLGAPPGELLCFPAELFGHTGLDFLVPPVFAAAVVASSACIVGAIGLWEAEEDSS